MNKLKAPGEHQRSSHLSIEDRILRFCSTDFKTREEIATELGRAVNTVRAHYLYPMVKRGTLETRVGPGKRLGQAYRARRPIK